MAVARKQLFIDVYDPTSGTKLATWINVNLNQFTKSINSGLSECILQLGQPYNYAGSDIAEGNEVKVYILDNDTAGVRKLIYWGYISMIEAEIAENSNKMYIHLLGYHTLLALDILQASAVTKVEYSAEDIGDIMKDLIDKFNAANPSSKLNYTSLTIPTVGQDITYTFRRVFYQQAMDKIRSYAPANYYFYIDENQTVNFKPKPTTPTHVFVLGKHFSAIKIQRGIEKLKNSLLIWNGEPSVSVIYKRYEEATSIAKYGRRTTLVDDYGVGNEATADMLSQNYLNENSDPEIVLEVDIFDNTENSDGKGYDIESIQPGDTCNFVGFSDAFSQRYLSQNMLITSVKYSLEKVTLTIDPRNLGIVDWQDQTAKNVQESASNTSPDTPYTT